MTTWLDPQPVDVPEALQRATGGLPLVAQTLVRRGIHSPEAARAFLDPAHYTPASPAALPGMDAAVARLWRAIREQEPVAVWGDFDADGQTSTALLLETLRALGGRVTSRVPKRDEGHGIHLGGLEQLINDGSRLILTCDTGVTAHQAVAHANRLGAEVIVTDHHVLGNDLPPALAVVNPHCLPPGHPMASLTGVGVAYQLARALDPALADRALDLVALGTVADVGTLTADNRYLVQRGLDALRHTARPGLQAVYGAAGLRPEGITEEHIGFVLGPRLNALGRLADETTGVDDQAGAARGVELLTTTDPTLARTLAGVVETLNARRQWLTRQITAAALSQIDRDPSLLADYHALVLSHPDWPGGIIGIVAGRLAQRFGKPALLISAPEGRLARGSGRSIPGVDLVAALHACATPAPRHPPDSSGPLLTGYGGHPGAAGFSLDRERIPEFRAAFSRAVAATSQIVPEPVLKIDAYVDLPDLTLDLVAEIGRLAPFGPGNPPLTLAVRDLRLAGQAAIGRTGEHLRLTVQDLHDRTQTVFWWQGADQPLPGGVFDLALTARASDYRGMAEIQLEWIDARPHQDQAVEIAPGPAYEIRDYRATSNPEENLRHLIDAGDVQVWAEGLALPATVEGRTRLALEPRPRLAVWTAPPGPREWQAALDRARPQEIILFALHSGLEERGAFLRELAGLANFALRNREGEVDLERAAARLGHCAGAVAAGLEHLEATAVLTIVERGEGTWRIEPATGHPGAQADGLAAARLDEYLAETLAYRLYFRGAPAASLARSGSTR
jgi:single-stranded-DNA-specific exonuclease